MQVLESLHKGDFSHVTWQVSILPHPRRRYQRIAHSCCGGVYLSHVANYMRLSSLSHGLYFVVDRCHLRRDPLRTVIAA